MAKIPDEIIQHIKDRARIEEVVGDFVRLRKTGVRYTGICPFHDDRHDGNFIVYPKENCYKCFTCDAKGGSIQFLMDNPKTHMSFLEAVRYLGKKYCIETDNIPFDYVPPPLPPPPPPRPTLILPRSVVAQRTGNLDGDPLCDWIKTGIRWDTAQRNRIDDVLRLYCVGHAKVQSPFHTTDEFTVFWQIDKDGQPRTAHYMKYKPNGKRKHKADDTYNTDWFHDLLIRRYDQEQQRMVKEPPYPFPNLYDPDRQEARQCLFGEHLLKRYPCSTVCIVESEKTALLMAIAYGNSQMGLWLACCGASNLTRERLKPLIDQHRRIILYPDRDGIQAWRQRAEQLHYDRVDINTKMVTDCWQESDGQKADIADVVVRMLNEDSDEPPAVVLADMMRKYPIAKILIEKFKLEAT